MNRFIRHIIRAVNRARCLELGYRIMDSYGTDAVAWTRTGALDWMRHCSPTCAVFRAHRLVMGRVVTR